MGTRYTLSDINSISRPVFFDANIIIYLFWQTGSVSFENKYARAFNQLRKSGNELYLNFSVISEVINRVVRIEQRKSGNEDLKFKDFRNSPDGESVLNDIYNLFEYSILPQFEIVDNSFSKEDIEEFLFYDQLDFNDKAIAQICQVNDFVLITNDTDFQSTEIDILSGHRAFH